MHSSIVLFVPQILPNTNSLLALWITSWHYFFWYGISSDGHIYDIALCRSVQFCTYEISLLMVTLWAHTSMASFTHNHLHNHSRIVAEN